jgi:hypothetical protein
VPTEKIVCAERTPGTEGRGGTLVRYHVRSSTASLRYVQVAAMQRPQAGPSLRAGRWWLRKRTALRAGMLACADEEEGAALRSGPFCRRSLFPRQRGSPVDDHSWNRYAGLTIEECLARLARLEGRCNTAFREERFNMGHVLYLQCCELGMAIVEKENRARLRGQQLIPANDTVEGPGLVA